MSDASTLHLTLCRGLTPAEAACFAAALTRPGASPTRGLLPESQAPLAEAWARAADLSEATRGEVGRAILARLEAGCEAPMAPLHPAWLPSWRRREPLLVAWLRGERTWSPERSAWLGCWAGHIFGVLDPRHAWELGRGEVLELDHLALRAAEEGPRVVQVAGCALLASALRGATRREQATTLAALAPEPSRRLLDALRRGEDFPEALLRFARARLPALPLVEDTAAAWLELGLMALAPELAGRHQHLIKPLCYALPPEVELLLLAHVERAQERQERREESLQTARPILAALARDAASSARCVVTPADVSRETSPAPEPDHAA